MFINSKDSMINACLQLRRILIFFPPNNEMKLRLIGLVPRSQFLATLSHEDFKMPDIRSSAVTSPWVRQANLAEASLAALNTTWVQRASCIHTYILHCQSRQSIKPQVSPTVLTHSLSRALNINMTGFTTPLALYMFFMYSITETGTGLSAAGSGTRHV